ncbi:uncharacterized protein B0T23DRAFT_16702 [Neurospora hispaniola]|uniref:Uncharacterized protein n=1 Tax=Neurospora hispaniola TaxID=588809 RepID=A0AAJ0IFJ3_9PEZI|nr:hypothetical protein B0T23DRAFT_16702 [Neurospora hispaniola]
MDSFWVQPPLLIDFHHFQLSRHKPNPHKREATPRPSCSPSTTKGLSAQPWRHPFQTLYCFLGVRAPSAFHVVVRHFGSRPFSSYLHRTGTPNRQAPAKDQKKEARHKQQGRRSPGLDFGTGCNTCAFTSYLHLTRPPNTMITSTRLSLCAALIRFVS